MTIEKVELTLRKFKSEPWIKLSHKFAYLNTRTGEEISGGRIARIEASLKSLKDKWEKENGTE